MTGNPQKPVRRSRRQKRNSGFSGFLKILLLQRNAAASSLKLRWEKTAQKPTPKTSLTPLSRRLTGLSQSGESERSPQFTLQQIDRNLEPIAALLRNSALFKIIEFLGLILLTLAALSYISQGHERQKIGRYQAWQTINSAQGKAGNGGRIEALEYLNGDRASLAGVNADKAYLVQIDLANANLAKASFREANLQQAKLQGANLQQANLQQANLQAVNLKQTDIEAADFRKAKNLKTAQIKSAKNWEKAKFDDDFRAILGLPPEDKQFRG